MPVPLSGLRQRFTRPKKGQNNRFTKPGKGRRVSYDMKRTETTTAAAAAVNRKFAKQWEWREASRAEVVLSEFDQKFNDVSDVIITWLDKWIVTPVFGKAGDASDY
jgi:hypothetical protein